MKKSKLQAYWFHAESGSFFVDDLIKAPMEASKQGYDLYKIGLARNIGEDEILKRLEKRQNRITGLFCYREFKKYTWWYNEETRGFEPVPF